MTPMPSREPQGQAPPDQGGQGQGDFFSGQSPVEQPQAEEQEPQDKLKGKLSLFRSADEMIDNIARQSQVGGKYAQTLKDALKKWMVEEVASTRERTPVENPRLMGA